MAKNVKHVEIHRELLEIHGENIIMMEWLENVSDNTMKVTQMFMTKQDW